MRIAILSSGNPNDMKGVMNYVQEKSKRFLAHSSKDEITIFLIRRYFSPLFALFSQRVGHNCESRAPKLEIDGVEYIIIWERYSLWNNLVTNKLFKRLYSNHFISRLAKKLNGYDILSTHNLDCNFVASQIKKKYRIPYVCTWHGSDINIDPYQNKMFFNTTQTVMKLADLNIFVSEALKKKSDVITINAKKVVVYTGPSDFFKRLSSSEIEKSKRKYAITGDLVLGFIGNIIEVKNVLTLSDIVTKTSSILRNKKIQLVIVGDGNLQNTLFKDLNEAKVNYLYLGKKVPQEIPSIMNCIDILILPSLNEGLPLVTLEALTCGVNVVASNVGGISEVIGVENCFDLGEDFVDNISHRISDIICNGVKTNCLSPEFSWDYAVDKEFCYYSKILEKS